MGIPYIGNFVRVRQLVTLTRSTRRTLKSCNELTVTT